MKTKLTSNSSREAFEDVQFNPDLVVVQKEHQDKYSHLTSLYVYNDVKDEQPVYAMFREITAEGSDFWKEVYNA
ncbi:MAG: modifier of suppressor tRNAs [Enterobacter phage ENC9]|nr:MAG: modifier of suppressor tRNAs [Enterobacter phage ENC9]